MSYKNDIGERGEELAAEFLEKSGYTVIARNYRISHDEIDIIAEDEKYIVFAEVKTRANTPSNRRYGRPASAVDYHKKEKLMRAATQYIRCEKPKKSPRIDVIEVYLPYVREGMSVDTSTLTAVKINHIRNAVHK